MDFLNEPYDTALLPKVEDLILKPVEKAYLTVIRIEWSISAAILFLIATILIFSINSLQDPLIITLISTVWLLLTLTYFLIQRKSFEVKGYALRDKDIIYRTGWIVQKIHTCPFNRIQHSSVNTGFIERKYGLATLVLFTAGTDEADLSIPGLKEDDAYAMREWITQKIIHEGK